MAPKNSEATENTEATGEGEETEAKVDNRHIWIEHAEYTGGERVKRTDWIREVYQDANNEAFFGNRGAIAKALTEMQGKDVPYQIVFAATKEIKGPAAEIKARKQAAKDAADAEKAEAAAAAENAETEEA